MAIRVLSFLENETNDTIIQIRLMIFFQFAIVLFPPFFYTFLTCLKILCQIWNFWHIYRYMYMCCFISLILCSSLLTPRLIRLNEIRQVNGLSNNFSFKLIRWDIIGNTSESLGQIIVLYNQTAAPTDTV